MTYSDIKYIFHVKKLLRRKSIRTERIGFPPWIRIRNTDLNKFKAQLAIYAPMIYMAPCIMLFLMRAASITRASGRGYLREVSGPVPPPPVRLSNITALVRLSNITALPPPPTPSHPSRTYLESTGNCKVHKRTLR